MNIMSLLTSLMLDQTYMLALGWYFMDSQRSQIFFMNRLIEFSGLNELFTELFKKLTDCRTI